MCVFVHMWGGGGGGKRTQTLTTDKKLNDHHCSSFLAFTSLLQVQPNRISIVLAVNV